MGGIGPGARAIGIPSIDGGTNDWSVEKAESAARHASRSEEPGTDWPLTARLVTRPAQRAIVVRPNEEMVIKVWYSRGSGRGP